MRQIEQALKEKLGPTSLDPEEIFTEVKTLGPIEIGELVKMVNDYIDEQKTES